MLPPNRQNTRITVLGYGSQGRAHALNLRDSGWNVRVGVRPNGFSWSKAEADGFIPFNLQDSIEGADLISVLLPDMVHAEVVNSLLPNLKPDQMLIFAHGFSVHYNLFRLPEHVDVALVAPKSPGALVRREYEQGNGVPCLVAVHQDASGTAEVRAQNYAKAIGGDRAGLITTTFAEETETDLFGEQAVLCGGVTELMIAGWETLVEAGYQPEIAYYECLHELKLIVDLLHEGGFERMHTFISDTASYGDLSRGSRVIDDHVRGTMKTILGEIRSGQFAKEWLAQQKAPGEWRNSLEQELSHPVEEVGRELRGKMAWLDSNEKRAS